MAGNVSLRAKKAIAYGAICVIWGSSWAVVKLGLETIPPLFSVGLRFTFATIVLGVVIALKRLPTPRKRSFWVLAAIMCVTSYSLPFGFIYSAQQQIDSGIAAVLFATFPLWVAVFSRLFLREETMTASRWLGIAFGFIGIAVIFRQSIGGVVAYPATAVSAILFGAAIQALGLIALRKMGSGFHPAIVNFWSFLLSAVILMISSAISEDYSRINFGVEGIFSIVYLACFSTVATFLAYFWLAARMEAVALSLTAFITPVLAVFVGIFLMSETMTSDVFIGSTITLGGILWMNWADIVYFFRGREAQKGAKGLFARSEEDPGTFA